MDMHMENVRILVVLVWWAKCNAGEGFVLLGTAHTWQAKSIRVNFQLVLRWKVTWRTVVWCDLGRANTNLSHQFRSRCPDGLNEWKTVAREKSWDDLWGGMFGLEDLYEDPRLGWCSLEFYVSFSSEEDSLPKVITQLVRTGLYWLQNGWRSC